MSHDNLVSLVAKHGQDHLLAFWGELSTDEQEQLASQILNLNFGQLEALVAGEDEKPDFAQMASRAVAPPAVKADGSGATWSVEQARQRGEQAIKSGEVGAVLVAGGQGTRLGFDQPKGMFPIGPVSNRTLFEFFADRLIAIGQHYGVTIPLYIMTSEATDSATREYFEKHNYLGLNQDDVKIFQQGTMPAVDSQTGKLLLASKSSLALSPDGHGGTVGALERNGCLADATQRGIKHLAYFQVDNPLVALCDPALIGHHLLAESEMTTQVVRKRYPTEKVGNVVLVDGSVQIIEYSDLPESTAQATDDSGELRLWAGNIAVHVIDVAFLQRMAAKTEALPFHRASKKVPHVDAAGQSVSPEQPNATKFERFIFDLLPAAKNAFVVEALPSEAFAPVKNANGAPADTPELARQAISTLHARWLAQAGATVQPGVQVEINPRYSLFSEQLADKIPANLVISDDQYFAS